jgi:hypothetical protein
MGRALAYYRSAKYKRATMCHVRQLLLYVRLRGPLARLRPGLCQHPDCLERCCLVRSADRGDTAFSDRSGYPSLLPLMSYLK